MRFLVSSLAICGLLSLAGCKGFSLSKVTGAFKKSDAAPPGESAKDRAKREGAETAFLAECAKLGAEGETVTGPDGWIFSAAELKRLGATPEVGSGTFSHAISCISDYRQQLKKSGINLVVALIPPKAIVYADEVSKAAKVPVKRGMPARMDSYYRAAAEALEQKGISVVDLTEAFMKARKGKTGPAFTKGSAGLTPEGARLAAVQIADAAKLDKGEVGHVEQDATLMGGNDLGGKEEKLPAKQVFRADGTTAVGLGEGGSPLLLICDGNGTAWRKDHASLAERLSLELQRPVDVLSGSNGRNEQRLKIMSRRTTARNPLVATKVVVWCFSAMDLASGDWRRVPLSLQFKDIEPQLRF